MRVQYYGRLSEVGGRDVTEIQAPAATVDELRHWLGERDERLAAELSRPGVRAVVNDTIVADDHSITASDEIAFIPPVSGG